MSGIAIVTGGTRGIGRCISEKLLGAGYKVFVTYARDEQAAASFMADFPDLSALQIDGRCIDQVQGLRDHILTLGTPSVVVNNAGITGDGIFLNASLETFNHVMETNFGSTLNYCNVFAPVLATARFGNIINVSSVAASKVKLGNTAYGCAKAAIERLTLGLALELARFDVKVNGIAPGFVDTDMFKAFAQGGELDILKSIPGRKILQPEEVANMIFLLATRQFNTTGTVIKVGNGENTG
ncbi:SDR family oxidoreductase [Pseudomonas fluorescens]|jgi:NAD(P)-dependent dehydrogenase (short-subunit alcohol dehydrogenase family)|uniref:SDR family NAD(P)-dependent oxidoreductase n=1 Tax=Pseudomonas fluorescens TaxID=294 RepID=UPI002ACB049F|nr:SDR family oxidoreductase [Pseudomonas fluorescens]MDZ5434587.1 SDR family oxidoreductase [Pseudomonas fluorescens]